VMLGLRCHLRQLARIELSTGLWMQMHEKIYPPRFFEIKLKVLAPRDAAK
jgi:hypothetical protein